MELLRYYLRSEIAELHQQGVRLRFIGDRSRLPADIVALIDNAEIRTAGNTVFTLVIALSYGSRDEILGAARRMAAMIAQGDLDPDAIGQEEFSRHLLTSDIPDPDLVIRTSGEQRLSNFLLWQSAYAELVFTKCLWPDFDAETLRAAVSGILPAGAPLWRCRLTGLPRRSRLSLPPEMAGAEGMIGRGSGSHPVCDRSGGASVRLSVSRLAVLSPADPGRCRADGPGMGPVVRPGQDRFGRFRADRRLRHRRRPRLFRNDERGIVGADPGGAGSRTSRRERRGRRTRSGWAPVCSMSAARPGRQSPCSTCSGTVCGRSPGSLRWWR